MLICRKLGQAAEGNSRQGSRQGRAGSLQLQLWWAGIAYEFAWVSVQLEAGQLGSDLLVQFLATVTELSMYPSGRHAAQTTVALIVDDM